MYENEQRYEHFMTEDAEFILVAYGISSRVCKSAVRLARQEGLKTGPDPSDQCMAFPGKSF